MGADDTIFALASGAGRAGVSIIRISGPHAGAALRDLTGHALPTARRASMRRLRDPAIGEAIDDALVLWFAGPNSFTGEDVAELHVHGGAAVISALINTLSTRHDCRLALPGEFTRRAFEHGKLDLTAAEAIADLVDAETEGQRRQALRQMEGGLAALYESWRARLIQAIALLEAEIDFPDEELPDGLSSRAAPLLENLAADIAAHLADDHRGERVRDGYRIAIIGAPNAGKSSLLNALARREAAIVSDIPGTTRDVVEVRLVLGGFPVWIADTAGLRAARDAIEAEGVKRALERAAEADLRIGVVDSAGGEIDAETRGALRKGDFLSLNKTDLAPGAGARAAEELARDRELHIVRIAARQSAGEGAGVPALLAALSRAVTDALASSEAPPLTRARHRAELVEAQAALTRALGAIESGAELAAEDARLAGRAIGRVTGRIDVEHVLDAIFAQFCIGK